MKSALKITLHEGDHCRGPLSAPIALIAYCDFECPHCGMAAMTIDQLIEEFGEDLCFAFRHFPLNAIHAQAEAAAIASEAAARQMQFWAMYHQLFTHQSSLSAQRILKLAEKLELDMVRFQRDLDDPALIERVHRDLKGGMRSGVKRTPALYLNGGLYEGSHDFASLAAAIEQLRHDPSPDIQL